jgi:hypothetical protein
MLREWRGDAEAHLTPAMPNLAESPSRILGYVGAPFLVHRTKCPLALVAPFTLLHDPGTYGAVSHPSLHDPSLGQQLLEVQELASGIGKIFHSMG